jgi:amidohydrolase
LRAGPQSAYCQDFQVEVCGRGGHGARPHNTIDPIAIAAELVTLIYQAVPRRTDARDPLVVTIGQISGGHAANVIPDAVKMKGTIRALDLQVLQAARENIANLCHGIAQTFGAAVRVNFDESLSGVVNDPVVTATCLEAARELVGPGNVLTEGRPSMGAEDFSDYLNLVPGCMIRLGAGRKQHEVTPLHTSTFDIDENALLVGARLLGRILARWPVERQN